MNIKLVTVTWSYEETFNIEETSLYKSFKKFNPNVEVEHFHFNRRHNQEKEKDFAARFGAESEYLLYKIELLLEKIKTVNSKYIIFCDANDVTCMRSVDYLIDIFDLENQVIVGHEKNTWPTQEIKNTWPNYVDYDEKHKNSRTFLNSGMILSKTDKFIEMLQSIVTNVFSTNINTFSNDQGVYTYYYNMGIEPKIKLDFLSIFALNTFSRNVNEYYLNKDNRLVSNETGITPCFIHDNGWNHGSPKYFQHFNLDRIYDFKYTVPEYFGGDSEDYYIINNAIKEVKNIPGIICEIGTRKGRSVKEIIDSLLENDDLHRNIVCIDPYGDLDYKIGEDRVIPGGYNNTMKSEFLISISDYIINKPVNLILLPIEDTEFFKRFYDGVPFYNKNKNIINDYAFVFFDGPHNIRDIMKEIEFFNSRSLNGSVWVFDDVSDFYPHNEIVEKWLFDNNWVLLQKTNKKASYKKL